MGFLNRRQAEHQPVRPQPIRPKKGKCKIKFKKGTDGSETFEATSECTEAHISRAMQMREESQRGRNNDE